MLKKLFLILFFFLTVSFVQKEETETYVDWQHSNSGYWMYRNGYNVYNDFDYMVSRSIYPDKYGYYSFYFWFYSQSYYWDGYRASYTSTNIRNVIVYINEGYGDKVISYDYTPIGITFFGQYCPFSLIFKSKSRTPMVVIRWNFMSAV